MVDSLFRGYAAWVRSPFEYSGGRVAGCIDRAVDRRIDRRIYISALNLNFIFL
jgi:hypothetical protein